MKFVIQYSKNARFIADSFQKMEEKDVSLFKFLLAIKGRVLKNSNAIYKVTT